MDKDVIVSARPKGPRPEGAASTPARRWLARVAMLLALGGLLTLLLVVGLRGSVALLGVVTAGIAVLLAAVWWSLSRSGPLRLLAAALAFAAPFAVAWMLTQRGLVWLVLVTAGLWLAALAVGRAALRETGPGGPVEYEVAPPRRPVLIMNPRSGGGKVERFALVERARELGAEVVLMDGPGAVDVAALARGAVAGGADLLGVAGGDGTQALVAGIAAEHGLPFMVISAGTRNHFALDLGLDRDDPASCLAALTDGVELRVDLGMIGDRTFVNNASFGAYATVVQSPAYRDDKARTTLELLPELLSGNGGPQLRVRAGTAELTGPQAVLVSNNPYAADDIAGLGRRPRLDRGVLGVLAVSLGSAGEAAGLVRGRRSRAITISVADEVVVDADSATVPVGVDGEALSLPTPVRCAIRPGALRVRVPRSRPGARPTRPPVDWRRLSRLALSAGR